MKTEVFPSIPEDLINALEKIYPNKLPDDPHLTVDGVRFLQGQQQVIDFLRVTYERQNKNILEAT